MSISYYSCEWCGEAIYEENCYNRSIDDDEICACDWCVEENTEKGMLIEMTSDNDAFNNYSPEIKKKIEYFGAHYLLTTSGIEIELNDIETTIQKLLLKKSELANKLSEMQCM